MKFIKARPDYYGTPDRFNEIFVNVNCIADMYYVSHCKSDSGTEYKEHYVVRYAWGNDRMKAHISLEDGNKLIKRKARQQRMKRIKRWR